MIKDRRLAIVEISFGFLETIMKADFEALHIHFNYKSSLPDDSKVVAVFPPDQMSFVDSKFRALMWSSKFEEVLEGAKPPVIDVTLTKTEKLS